MGILRDLWWGGIAVGVKPRGIELGVVSEEQREAMIAKGRSSRKLLPNLLAGLFGLEVIEVRVEPEAKTRTDAPKMEFHPPEK